MHIRYFNIGVYMLKTWTRGTSKTLENLFHWVQLIFSKNLSKDRVYSLNRSIQSFLTRFPLFKMLTRLPSPLIFYISNSQLIFTSFTHFGSINLLPHSTTTTILIGQSSRCITSKWTFKQCINDQYAGVAYTFILLIVLFVVSQPSIL